MYIFVFEKNPQKFQKKPPSKWTPVIVTLYSVATIDLDTGNTEANFCLQIGIFL